MKIDSSGEEEDAVNDVGSAMNLCDRRLQSDLQGAVKRYLKLLCINEFSSLYSILLSVFLCLSAFKSS